MVQLTDHSRFGQRGETESLDLYWKLDNGSQYDRQTLIGILKDKKFSCGSRTSRARTQELYVRYQRGFLSYEGTTSLKLRSYINRRKLPFAAESASSLKAQLEQADENATFDRFLSIPAELRLRIYSHYFRSFIGTRANIISQPPITGVSQDIRKESLPVFYGLCDFTMRTMDLPSSPGNSVYDQQTDRLLKIAAAEQFGWVQHITMRLDFEGCEIELTVDISNKRTPVKVFHLLKLSNPTHLSEAQSNFMSSKIVTLVNGIVAREGVSKLQNGDLEGMHEIVRSILVQRGN